MTQSPLLATTSTIENDVNQAQVGDPKSIEATVHGLNEPEKPPPTQSNKPPKPRNKRRYPAWEHFTAITDDRGLFSLFES
ncbi:hypothetical protein LguiA_006563 [Lonicera macranthoides]